MRTKQRTTMTKPTAKKKKRTKMKIAQMRTRQRATQTTKIQAKTPDNDNLDNKDPDPDTDNNTNQQHIKKEHQEEHGSGKHTNDSDNNKNNEVLYRQLLNTTFFMRLLQAQYQCRTSKVVSINLTQWIQTVSSTIKTRPLSDAVGQTIDMGETTGNHKDPRQSLTTNGAEARRWCWI